MKKMAMFLYKRICILGIPLFCRKQVETDLAGLHPGERVEYIKTEYYVKKITLFLTVLFVGAFLGLVVKVNGKRDAVLSEGGVVHRGSYQSGEQKLFLKADDGEKEKRTEERPKTETIVKDKLSTKHGDLFDKDAFEDSKRVVDKVIVPNDKIKELVDANEKGIKKSYHHK